MTSALYNEIEPFAAQWLRNLIAAGHIANGVVDERSIADLTPDDVAGPGQRHFFAGIGGWSYALQLANVPDDASIWTGSCPCQPFSQAGARRGIDDPRHLWPTWFALIRECRPAIVFGEQVAGPDGLAWLDVVFADLEGCGYACGAAVISAGGVGAPHARHRLYFVANSDEGARDGRERVHVRQGQSRHTKSVARGSCAHDVMGNGRSFGLEDDVKAGAASRPARRSVVSVPNSARIGRLGRNANQRRQAWGDAPRDHEGLEWIEFPDGKRRPIKPGLSPLAHGVSARMERISGSGNAIVPQAAVPFIVAALGARKAVWL